MLCVEFFEFLCQQKLLDRKENEIWTKCSNAASDSLYTDLVWEYHCWMCMLMVQLVALVSLMHLLNSRVLRHFDGAKHQWQTNFDLDFYALLMCMSWLYLSQYCTCMILKPRTAGFIYHAYFKKANICLNYDAYYGLQL